jgi:hypothetical protein
MSNGYHDVDRVYIEFLKLCFENPRLDCYSAPTGDGDTPLTIEEQLKQKILYAMLTDIFEDVFIEYKANAFEFHGTATGVRDNQWKGWDIYISTNLQTVRNIVSFSMRSKTSMTLVLLII